jgi:hypothetical protein
MKSHRRTHLLLDRLFPHEFTAVSITIVHIVFLFLVTHLLHQLFFFMPGEGSGELAVTKSVVLVGVSTDRFARFFLCTLCRPATKIGR